MNTSELIRSDNESVFVVRVDHGQVIVDCINAGEIFSPSGTAVEMFEKHLARAGADFMEDPPSSPVDLRLELEEFDPLGDGSGFEGPDRPRSSVEQLRAKVHPFPVSDPHHMTPEQRLDRLEAACHGIVRDYEIRQQRQLYETREPIMVDGQLLPF